MDKKILLAIVPVILVMAAISVTPALAGVVSPLGCSADRSGVDLAKSTLSASVGQTITFTVSASNPTSIDGCDIINRTITLTLPNGTTKSFGPNNYPNPTPLTFVGNVDYVAKLADVVGGSWAATASSNGTQLDGANSVSTQSKGAFVTYVPVNLTVVKTAVPAIQQTYTWTIDKNVTPTSLNLSDGQTGSVNYTVAVVKSLPLTVDTVSGAITITNPSAFASAHVTGVVDVISPAIGTTVNCGGFPFDIAPLAQENCTYTATVPDSTSRVNTATVTTTGDIGGGSGTANVNFTGVTPTVIGGSINVDDTNGGSWPFSATGSVKYSRTFDCSGLTYDASGHASYSHVNTATIRGTALHHDATVNVDCYKPLPAPSPAPSMSPFVMVLLISALAIIGLIKIKS